MAIIKPDPVSLTTHHLHLAYEDGVLGSGTGFTYVWDGELFLITNWHNVTGRHPETKKCLHKGGGLPDKISTLFREREKPAHCSRVTIPLYSDEDRLDPVWFEHPEFREKVDVVAIPLPKPILEGKRAFPINEMSFDAKYKTEVADEAFIIGYPFSEVTHLQLPIWKKASIASEPDVNLDQLPKMLVDTATRAGLSGSPVIMQRVGIHRAVQLGKSL